MLESLLSRPWKRLRFEYTPEHGILWYYTIPNERLCYSPDVLGEIQLFQREVALIKKRQTDPERPLIRFLVAGSDMPGVFNLGGDLDLIQKLVVARDRRGLERYARLCVEVLYANAVNLNVPVTTLTMVEGRALGGGFEAALSSSIVVADRSVHMGFPEMLFNLFPGMGAYHLLCRRLPPNTAERIIRSGRNYDAEELHALGLIDILCEKGESRTAVLDYIRHQGRVWNGHIHFQQVRHAAGFFSFDELMDAARIWVDAALELTERDLRKMNRLVNAQDRMGRRLQSGADERRLA